MKKIDLGWILPSLSLFLLLNSSNLAAEEKPFKPWEEKAELSLLSKNGNSQETTFFGKNIFSYGWKKYVLEVAGSALETIEKNTTTAEEYSASEELTRTFTKRSYTYERFAWEKNRFSGIQNQFHPSVGLGQKFLDSLKNHLKAEIGVGYFDEERTNETTNTFATGRSYTKYSRVFNETSELSQDLEYIANFDDTNGYRIRMETDLIVSLSNAKHIALKASYLWKRINHPLSGFGKDDSTTSLSLILQY